MLKLVIVYPVFNGLEFTKNSLISLYSEHQIERLNANIMVVIVDDGSTDGTNDWILKNYPQVHLLKGNGTLWWSGGINMAVRYAIDELDCDYILWWNNDVVAETDYFPKLINHLNAHDPKTIIGSKIFLAHNKNIVWSMGGLFDINSGAKSMIGSMGYDSDLLNKKTECDWLPGMGTVTHKSVYEKIGMLDEKRFPQYHGDSDFTLRAKKTGYKILVYPDLKIYNDNRNTGIKHDGSSRRLIQSLFSLKSNYNIKKDFLFYKKHTESIMTYLVLLRKYSRYIGGFIKWKIVGLLGVRRNRQNSDERKLSRTL